MQGCVRCFFARISRARSRSSQQPCLHGLMRKHAYAHLNKRGLPGGRLSPHYLIGGAYLKRAENVPAGANAPRGTNAGEDAHIQEFLDMIAPSVIKFETDHFICGNTYRCVWALREYPTATDEQAILSRLGEKDGVTLRIYTRHVMPVEERKIISNAANKNRMDRGNTNDL